MTRAAVVDFAFTALVAALFVSGFAPDAAHALSALAAAIAAE